MKKYLLLTTFILFAMATYSQQNNFKIKNKKQPGTLQPSIHFQKINGGNNLKSATLPLYKGMISMVKPDLQHQGVLVKKIMKDNSPVYIETKSSNLKSANIQTAEERFQSFFETTRKTTGISNPSESMKIKSIQTDELGIIHIKSVQYYKGVEIYGSESTLHFDQDKERFTGRIFHLDNELNVNPDISANGALTKTVNNLKELTTYKELSKKEKDILHYDLPLTNLVVFKNDDQTFSLAWEIEIRPNFIEIWKYFIDAHSGEILRKFNATNSDGPTTASAYDLNNVLRPINTYLEKGTYYLIDISKSMFQPSTFEGAIMTLNANNTSTRNLDYSYITSSNNTWNNKTAVSAHANVIETYNYFYNTFGRNSLNNKGSSILAFINVTNDDGTAMDNAFWNGEAAFFGNGKEFKPLAGAQDVISHELGHGVVSNTANLEYYAQSGAINESFADIFGSMVDRDDWTIGEDIIKSGKPMRNMQDPHNGGTTVFDGWQPRHMSEFVTGSVLDNFTNRDQEGVHINNGIGNYAFYLFATAVTKTKAEQVFYRALANYLTKSSQFLDLRIAVIQSAKDLYGENSTEAKEAAKAFDQVGIYGETPVEENPQYEENQGDEFLISYNTDATISTKLYRSSTSGDDFVALTKTDMKGKVSVTDDGAVAAYVTTDDKIRALTLDPASIEEFIISAEAFWDNVAVSKDGMRLAAISNEIDASIYVYDFGTEVWQQFQLYNPTTSDSIIEAGGVLYADEIEFDITGEYLIYDAYNELTSTTTDDISYWDIGFIKVWDNAKNTFGDGSISKLYGSLPEKVSIGNPVFSKNSPNIIAFDYMDESNNEFAVIGADLLTSDIDVIYSNTTLGFPNFSTLDNQIAFTATSTEENEVVAVVNLAANKISAAGDALLLIDKARWPVYFATGTRTLGLPPTANFTADYKSGAAPFTVRFIDASLNDPTSWKWTFTGGTPSTSTQQNPTVTYNNTGIFQVSLTATNSYGNNTSTKTNYIEVTQPNSSVQSKSAIISFFPNPVTNLLNISCDENFIINLSNLNGQLILRKENKKQIDLSGLPAGFYFIELKTGDQIIREKILKN
jgi:Zn-dependent metalloprotease/PKD repeat protein